MTKKLDFSYIADHNPTHGIIFQQHNNPTFFLSPSTFWSRSPKQTARAHASCAFLVTPKALSSSLRVRGRRDARAIRAIRARCCLVCLMNALSLNSSLLVVVSGWMAALVLKYRDIILKQTRYQSQFSLSLWLVLNFFSLCNKVLSLSLSLSLSLPDFVLKYLSLCNKVFPVSVCLSVSKNNNLFLLLLFLYNYF